MLRPYLETLHFASVKNPLATMEHPKCIKSIFSSIKKLPTKLIQFETSPCSVHVVGKLLEKLVSLLSSFIIICFCTYMVRSIIRKQEARGNANSHNIQICKPVSLRKSISNCWLQKMNQFRNFALYLISKAFVSF